MADQVQAPETDEIKAGHKTTEFWLHFASVLLSALGTIAGVILALKHGEVTPTDAFMTFSSLAGGIVSASKYTSSRTAIKTAAVLLLAIFLGGCASPAEDYVRAEAAAWAPFDEGGKLDLWIDREPTFSDGKKDALHQLNAGRRARVAHGLAAVGSASK